MDRKKSTDVVIFLAGLFSFLISSAAISLAFYNFFEIFGRDVSKIDSQFLSLLYGGLFSAMLALIFFIWGLKRTLPKDNKMASGIVILSGGAIFLLLALFFVMLALFNRYSTHDQNSFSTCLFYALKTFSVAVVLSLLGYYRIKISTN